MPPAFLAIAPVIASLATAAASVGTGAYQAVEGASSKKDAKHAAFQQQQQQEKLLNEAKGQQELEKQLQERDRLRRAQKSQGAAFDGRGATILTGSSPSSSTAFSGRTILGG